MQADRDREGRLTPLAESRLCKAATRMLGEGVVQVALVEGKQEKPARTDGEALMAYLIARDPGEVYYYFDEEEKRDKRGHRYCLNGNGERVACGDQHDGGDRDNRQPARNDKDRDRRRKVDALGQGGEDDPNWGEITGQQSAYLADVARDKAKRQAARDAFVAKVVEFFKAAGKGLDEAEAQMVREGGVLKLLAKASKVGRAFLRGLAALGLAVDHALEKGKEVCQRMAQQAAVERGLGERHAEGVGEVVALIDNVLAWTANIPVAHEVLHDVAHVEGWLGFFGAKIGYYFPVGSLAYLLASAVRNPAALCRAAQKVWAGEDVGSEHGKEKQAHALQQKIDNRTQAEDDGPVDWAKIVGMEAVQKPLCGKDLMGELQQGMHDAGDQADWYLALYCTAIDRVHDSRRALEMADKAIRKHRDGNALAEKVTPEDVLSLFSGHRPPMPYHVAEE